MQRELVSQSVTALSFAAKIEVGMIREIQHGIFVSSRRVLNANSIVVRDRVCNINGQITWEAFLTILTEIAEPDRLTVRYAHCVRRPDAFVESLRATMLTVVAVV